MGVGGQRHAPVALLSKQRPVPIVQEAGWAPRPVWRGGENLTLTGIRSRTIQHLASRYTDYAVPARTNWKGCEMNSL